jgi:hypothetical protein
MVKQNCSSHSVNEGEGEGERERDRRKIGWGPQYILHELWRDIKDSNHYILCILFCIVSITVSPSSEM